MYKGIFWCYRQGVILKGKEETSEVIIIPVKVKCDENGNVLEEASYSSKSGENFNHKVEWDKLKKGLKGGHPYNYYPRGRVEIRNGKIKVFANPVIFEDAQIIKTVFESFEIEKELAELHADNSYHYRFLYEEPQG